MTSNSLPNIPNTDPTMTSPDALLAAAWDLWRESSCLERGGHFWARQRGMGNTRPCRSCPVMLRDCDVCGGEFTTADGGRFRCSDACREFARAHKHASSAQLRQLWKLEREQERAVPCPSGKVRHQKKAAAEASARTAERQRYRGVRQWLRVYECGLCHGWHLTSKPGGRRAPASRKRAA